LRCDRPRQEGRGLENAKSTNTPANLPDVSDFLKHTKAIRNTYGDNSAGGACANMLICRKIGCCMLGNLKNLEIWQVYVSPILHVPLYALPVWGVHIANKTRRNHTRSWRRQNCDCRVGAAAQRSLQMCRARPATYVGG
jgi:hypothetical protein